MGVKEIRLHHAAGRPREQRRPRRGGPRTGSRTGGSPVTVRDAPRHLAPGSVDIAHGRTIGSNPGSVDPPPQQSAPSAWVTRRQAQARPVQRAPFRSRRAHCRRTGVRPASGDRAAPGRRRGGRTGSPGAARQHPGGPQPLARRRRDLRQRARHARGAQRPPPHGPAAAQRRSRPQGVGRGLHRRAEHRRDPLHPPQARPDREEVRRDHRAGAGRALHHRADQRHARTARAGHGPHQGTRRQGRRHGVGRDHHGERGRRRRPPVAAPAGRRRRRARPRDREHGTGEPAPAAPDARPGPVRDDPDVRTPRRRTALGPRE